MFLVETRLSVDKLLGINSSWVISHNSETRAAPARGGRLTTDGIMIVARNKQLAEATMNLHEEKGLTAILLNQLVIACIYSPPSEQDHNILKLISKATEIANGRELIVLGDYNARLGVFNGDHYINSRGRLLLDFLQDSDLIYQHPHYGRYTSFSGSGRGIPDHIISSTDAISNIHIRETNSMGGSDHRLITFDLEIAIVNESREFTRPRIRQLHKVHKQKALQQKLTMEFANLNWDKDIESLWYEIKSTIDTSLKQTVGILEYKSRSKTFYTSELQNLQRETVRLSENLQLFIERGCQAPIIRTAQARLTEVQKLFRRKLAERTKELFDSFTAEVSKSKNTAALMKVMSCRKRRKNRKKASLDTTQLDSYIEYFKTTFGGDPLGEPERMLHLADRTEKFEWTEMDLFTELIHTATGKATGIDQLYGEVFKFCAGQIAPILTKFFNRIETDLTIPHDWTQAMICPVYKKGDKTNIANYRPIALTSVCRRIYERLIKGKLDAFTNKLQDSQGGFRPKRSTLMQVLSLHEITINNPDLIMINLDFKAAYDLVNRQKLWRMMKYRFQVPDMIIQRLKMLFDNNESCIVYNCKKSKFIPNKRGLLQGSSLSPVLFNFFIDEMLLHLQQSNHKVSTYGYRTNHLAFADDVNIHARSPAAMKALLKIVEDWSLRVGMRFAPSKCILISSASNPEYKLYEETINHEPISFYLGIAIATSGIHPTQTVARRLDNAKKITAILTEGGMNLGGFTPSASINLYKTFIRPTLEYGMQLMIYPTEEIQAIQKIQNTALRSILSAPKTTSINAMHKLLHIPFIKERNIELQARFHGQLHNNRNATIPAVNIWWKGKLNSNRSSLIYQAQQKNPLWLQTNKRPHGFNGNNLTRGQNQIQEPLTKAFRYNWHKQKICTLDRDTNNVAGSILLEPKDPLRACLKPSVLPMEQRVAIVKWITGGVARHKPCLCGVELSREHAINCSGAGELIQHYFTDDIDRDSPINHISQVLNIHRNSRETRVYNVVFDAIKLIYENCLGYRQRQNGFFAASQDDHQHRTQIQTIENRTNPGPNNYHRRHYQPNTSNPSRRQKGVSKLSENFFTDTFDAWQPP
jgi:hypothetical protein